MATSCNDVCDVVIEQLEKLGYTFDDTEDHDQILDALVQCKFQRQEAVCTHNPQPIFPGDDGLRQYYKCSNCGQVTT